MRISRYSINDIQSVHLEFHPTLYNAQLSRPHHESIIIMDIVIKIGWVTSQKKNPRAYFPNSVCMSKRPCWGRINMSPSLFQKAFFSIDVLARYICMASPSRREGSPLPAIVFSPSTKSTLSEGGGRSKGCHANWVGLIWTLELSGRKQDSSLDLWVSQMFMRWKIRTDIRSIRQASESLMSNGWSNAIEPPKRMWMRAYVDRSRKKLGPRMQVLSSWSNERWSSHL